MDLGPGPTFSPKTQPKGSKPAGVPNVPAAKFGHIISIGANIQQPSKDGRQRHLELGGIISGDTAFAGLNEAGLSCDLHALVNSSYPQPSSNASANLLLYHFCNWALGSYSTSAEVKRALEAGVVHLYGPSAVRKSDSHPRHLVPLSPSLQPTR